VANLPAKRSTVALTLPGITEHVTEAGRIPLDMAEELTGEALLAAGRFATAAEKYGPAVRLAVGAALTKQRSDFASDWTEWFRAYAMELGRSTDSLSRWMVAAQKEYNLPAPKGAIPSRRREGPRPALANPPHRAEDSASDDDVAVDPIETGSETAATVSSDVPKPEEPQVSTPGRASKPPVTTPRKDPHTEPPAVALRKATPEDDIVAAWNVILNVHPNELGKAAQKHRTKAGAVERAMTLACADLDRKAAGHRAPSVTPTTPPPVVPPQTIRCGHRFGEPCADCVKAARKTAG